MYTVARNLDLVHACVLQPVNYVSAAGGDSRCSTKSTPKQKILLVTFGVNNVHLRYHIYLS
jgi:hypothetical protein